MVKSKQEKYNEIVAQKIKQLKDNGIDYHKRMDDIKKFAKLHCSDYTLEEHQEIMKNFMIKDAELRRTNKMKKIRKNLSESYRRKEERAITNGWSEQDLEDCQNFSKKMIMPTNDLGTDFGLYVREFIDKLLTMYLKYEDKSFDTQVKAIGKYVDAYRKDHKVQHLIDVGFNDDQIKEIKKALHFEDAVEGNNEDFLVGTFWDAFHPGSKAYKFDLKEFLKKNGKLKTSTTFDKAQSKDYQDIFDSPEFKSWASTKKMRSYIKGMWTKINNRYHKANDDAIVYDQEFSNRGYYTEAAGLLNGLSAFNQNFWLDQNYFDAIKMVANSGKLKGTQSFETPATAKTWIDNHNHKDNEWIQIQAPAHMIFPKLEVEEKQTIGLIPIKTKRSEKLQELDEFYHSRDCWTSEQQRKTIDKFKEVLDSTDPDLDTPLKKPDTWLLNKVTKGYSWKNMYSHEKSFFMAAVSNNSFAIKCGQCTRDKRLICLDFDSDKDGNTPLTDKQIDYIQNHYFGNTGFMWQRTQSNGIHIFALVDNDSNAFTKNEGNKSCYIRVDEDGMTIGCDVRTDNGYVVVSGKGYQNIHCNIRRSDLFERMEGILLDADEIDRLLCFDGSFRTNVRSISKRIAFDFRKKANILAIDRNVKTPEEAIKAYLDKRWQVAFRYLYRSNRIYQLVSIPEIDKNQISELNMTIDQTKKATNNRHIKSTRNSMIVPSQIRFNNDDIASPQIDFDFAHFGNEYQEGNRNTICFTLSCWLRLNNWDKFDTLDFVDRMNGTSEDPLSEEEVERTVNSVYKKSSTNLYGVAKEDFSLVNKALVGKDDVSFNLTLTEQGYKKEQGYREPVERARRVNSHYDETFSDLLDILITQYSDGENKLRFNSLLTYEKLTNLLNSYINDELLTRRSFTDSKLSVSAVKKIVTYIFSYPEEGTTEKNQYDHILRIISVAKILNEQTGKLKSLNRKYETVQRYQEDLTKIEEVSGLISDVKNKTMRYIRKPIFASLRESEKLMNYLRPEEIVALASIRVERKKGKGIIFRCIDKPLFKLAFALKTNASQETINALVHQLSLPDDLAWRTSLHKLENDLNGTQIDSSDKTNDKNIDITSLIRNDGDSTIPIVISPVRTLPLITGR